MKNKPFYKASTRWWKSLSHEEKISAKRNLHPDIRVSQLTGRNIWYIFFDNVSVPERNDWLI